MSDKSIERRARLLFGVTLFIIAIGAGAWYLLSKGQYTRYQILTQDAVSGLIQDSPVEFHGVQVGQVTSVELLDPNTVRILLAVKRDTPISTATTATITSRGLSPKGFTGYVYIALEDTGADASRKSAAPGDDFATIPTVPARDISLDAEISEANARIHALLDQATVASLKEAVESVQQIATTLAENNTRLISLIANAERASKQLAPLIQSSSDSIRTLQTQILPEAYKALSDLEKLSSALNGAAEEIGRDPSILFRGRAPPEPAPGEGK